MTSPVDGYIQLPLDTSNTGKKRRTQTRVVGSDTVHEDFVVPISKRNILGNYIYNVAPAALPITAHNGTTTGILWLVNPTANTENLAIKRILAEIQFTASAIDTALGLLRGQRFTYTGTPSGATLAASRQRTTDIATGAVAYTAMTGMTITLGEVIFRRALPMMFSATAELGQVPPTLLDFFPKEEGMEFVLAPGEGLVLFSPVTLTTANRTATIEIQTQEYESTL